MKYPHLEGLTEHEIIEIANKSVQRWKHRTRENRRREDQAISRALKAKTYRRGLRALRAVA